MGDSAVSGWSLDSVTARTYLDSARANRPLSRAIVQGTAFTAANTREHAELFQSRADTFYLRFGHPADSALAEKLAILEEGEAAAVFSSGMAAIATALMTHLPPGSHLIAGDQIFEQTSALLRWLAAGRGVAVDFVDTRDSRAIDRSVRAETRVVYVETPSNPTLRISDIAAASHIARRCGALLFVDSTFATPFAQQPLKHGAHLVLHSGTKLLSGHMDVMFGAAVGSAAIVGPIHQLRRLLGGVLDPHASWLAQRGIRTLGVRAERAFGNALRLARHLASSPQVASVTYPLLESHESAAVARRQMSAGGIVVSFRLAGGIESARRFLDALKLIQIASSLGGVETVIELPMDLDWRDECESRRTAIDHDLIRLSVGLEDFGDLRADIDQALRQCAVGSRLAADASDGAIAGHGRI